MKNLILNELKEWVKEGKQFFAIHMYKLIGLPVILFSALYLYDYVNEQGLIGSNTSRNTMFCNPVECIANPVYVEYYKEGQTLEPSYACPDTLIVIDAVALNTEMGYIEQGFKDDSDSDIDNILHKYCVIK